MTKEEISSLVRAIDDLMTVLSETDPTDKAEVYQRHGLTLTYDPVAWKRGQGHAGARTGGMTPGCWVTWKAGTPVKTVSERLGHASVTATLTVYGHVMPGDQKRAASPFAALVGEG